jgi:polyisoprenoid-binding protein YceI
MFKRSFSAFTVIAFFALTACKDPTKEKPRAEVKEVDTPTAAPAAPAAGAESLAFNSQNSKIDFVASKVTKSHDGKFNQFTGTMELVNGKPEGGKVSVEIDLASVETDAEKLTGHLKSADFFDVAKHPKATFASTEVKAGAPAPSTHTVTGNFDLHGVKKSISFPATIGVSDSDVTVKAEFSINRKDFGINYPGASDDLIRDNVLIKLDVKAPRKK